MVSRRIPLTLIAALALPLAGCGERADLRPPKGHDLPGAPYGRVDRPTSRELVKGTPQSRPGLNIELETRSQERADDPFDLPPKE